MLTQSRLERIARGSGCHPGEIMMLLESFKPMQKAAAGMKNMKLPMGKNGDMSKMPTNMNMANLSKMLPPQMMQKMGGMQGLTVI